jgi:hypothetical protein
MSEADLDLPGLPVVERAERLGPPLARIGKIVCVAFLAWFCLRGYRGDSDNSDQK